jgi:hypothetical protein
MTTHAETDRAEREAALFALRSFEDDQRRERMVAAMVKMTPEEIRDCAIRLANNFADLAGYVETIQNYTRRLLQRQRGQETLFRLAPPFDDIPASHAAMIDPDAHNPFLMPGQ